MLMETVISRGRHESLSSMRFLCSTFCYKVWVSREETVMCMRKINKMARQGRLPVFVIAIGLPIQARDH